MMHVIDPRVLVKPVSRRLISQLALRDSSCRLPGFSQVLLSFGENHVADLGFNQVNYISGRRDRIRTFREYHSDCFFVHSAPEIELDGGQRRVCSNEIEPKLANYSSRNGLTLFGLSSTWKERII